MERLLAYGKFIGTKHTQTQYAITCPSLSLHTPSLAAAAFITPNVALAVASIHLEAVMTPACRSRFRSHT
jgi:hypothetical protein